MRNNRTLTKYVADFTFGDGSICIDKRDWDKNGNAWFECSHIEPNIDYLEWKQSILTEITGCSLVKLKYRAGKFPNGKTANCKEQYRIRTSRHPFFNKIRNRLYHSGRKTIDPHYLKETDWESLAIWYMDDGCLAKEMTQSGKMRYRIHLCTQSYTQTENIFIKRLLKEKFNLEFNLNRIKYPSGLKYNLILNYQDQVDTFIENIQTHILPSFEYKIDISRTTSSTNNLVDDDIV